MNEPSRGLRAVSQIDLEHSVELKMVATLRQAIVDSTPGHELASLADRFVRFTESHFAAEQLHMGHFGYPGLGGHAAEHDGLMRQFTEVLTQAQKLGKSELLEIVDRLEEWLRNHIASEDEAFRNWLLKRDSK